MLKVSVIVPIYNKENVLKKNVETILKQTLKEIEIILVNDGSTDNSGQICNEIQKNDNRVKVIHQENKGVSAARNKGLSLSKGEYISFIDPDDWIERDMYKSMYKKIKETESEVCLCNFSVDKNNNNYKVLLDTPFDILDRNQIYEKLILNMIAPENIKSSEGTVMGSVWRLLISKKIINKYNLSFKEKLPIMEDLLFTIDLLAKTNQVCIDKNVHYHYVQDSESAINKYRPDLIHLNTIIMNELIKSLEENNIYRKSIPRIKNRYINLAQNEINNEIKSEEPIRKKISNISKICSNNKLIDSLKIVDYSELTLRKKIVICSLKNKNSIILYVYFYLLNKIKHIVFGN